MSCFFTVKQSTCNEIKVKRSRFICTLFPVKTIEETKTGISDIANQHKTANHNCWAYIVGNNGKTFHSSDAGEPSGTAGKPMLNMLQKYQLANVGCVVTRYFGGIKLGIRGLIEAYGESVEKTIEQTSLIKIVEIKKFNIETDYKFFEIFKYQLEQHGAEVVSVEYQKNIDLLIQIEKEKSVELENYLQSMQQAGKISILPSCLGPK